jgi:hypothetical protein
VHSHGTKSPLLAVFFSFYFFSLSSSLTFFPEGVIVQFKNCKWGVDKGLSEDPYRRQRILVVIFPYIEIISESVEIYKPKNLLEA